MLAVLAPVAALAQQTPPPQQASQSATSAQADANPVSSAVRGLLERQSKNILAAVDEMPADKFTYRPTPAQITFGHLVMHMAGSNFHLCAAISGMEAPKTEELKETDPKEKLAAALKSSFDFCTTSAGKNRRFEIRRGGADARKFQPDARGRDDSAYG
jgi:hypothetical protein